MRANRSLARPLCFASKFENLIPVGHDEPLAENFLSSGIGRELQSQLQIADIICGHLSNQIWTENTAPRVRFPLVWKHSHEFLIIGWSAIETGVSVTFSDNFAGIRDFTKNLLCKFMECHQTLRLFRLRYKRCLWHAKGIENMIQHVGLNTLTSL